MRELVRAGLVIALLLSQVACEASRTPRSSARSSAEDAAPAVREGFVDAGDGVRLFFRLVGSGPDPVVVLHGGPGFNMEYLAADLQSLAERHPLLFYDQRGTGRSSLVSDSEALDAQRFADDLEAIRRHFELEQLTMLGHSWGAGVAALYAARYPDRVGGLLIVGGMPLRRSERDRALRELDTRRDSATRLQMQERRSEWHANPGDADACRAYYTLWFEPFFGDSADASRSHGDFCAGPPEALRNKVASVDRFTGASLGDWDWRQSLATVTARALVIHGTSDVFPVDSAREWAAALPNGRLLLLEGIGHFSYLEAPERFNDAVDAFLGGRWPAGAEAVASP
jgi:proline iminopeptidase